MKKISILILAAVLFGFTYLHPAYYDIRLNSLGFLPTGDKKASIDVSCTTFNLVRASDGTAVSTGTVSGPFAAADSGETIWIADFSSYTTPGTYFLSVPGVGNSIDFNIADGIYNNAFYMAMKALYLARCGTAVSYTYPADSNTYAHGLCHDNDAYLDNVGGPAGATKTSKEGWHDAGDYNKYIVDAGETLGMLFIGWEQFQNKISQIPLNLPVTAAGYPEYLEEIKWETDWFLTMQTANGGVYDKVSEVTFCGFIMPEANTVNRYFWGYNNIGTVETAIFCATMAMASRIFAPYDSAYSTTCLNEANAAYSYLINNPVDTVANVSGCGTGNATSSDPEQARLWAAAEMWETTGNSAMLTDFETRAASYAPNYVDVDFDWEGDKNLGMYTYALSAKAGRNPALLAAIQNNIIYDANSITTTTASHPYGRPLGTNYYWGCNGSNARTSMLLQIANQLSPSTNYINGVIDAVSYLYGRNTHDRSYVTGVGIYAPMNPHHRPSGSDGIVNPWPGYLVGGSAGNNQQDPVLTLTPTGLPPAEYWADQQNSWSSNEVCLNWQGALVYALSGCIGNAGPSPTPTPAAVPASCGTGITIDGNLNDAAWQTGDWASFNRLVSGLDPNGTSAKFKVRWDNNYLYVAVAVSTSSPHNDSVNYFDDDSVEIYLDMFHDKSAAYNPGALNDFEFSMRYNDQTIRGQYTTGVLGHTAATPDGYAVEMAFPWTTLNATPLAGAIYGFDVGINVNPNGGTPRDGVLMWHGDSNNWQDTSKFGDMQLGLACGSSPTYTISPTATQTVSATCTVPGATLTATAFETNTLTPTPAITATPTSVTSGNLEIGPIKPYPNPYNPALEPLKIRVNMTPTDIDSIKLEIYTMAYRLIKEKTFEGTEMEQVGDGVILTCENNELSGLSSGTYYYFVVAEKDGAKARSRADTIIILR